MTLVSSREIWKEREKPKKQEKQSNINNNFININFDY